MTSKIIYKLVILLLVASVSGAFANDGIESPFAFGVGARNQALNGAGVAICSPATASFWNSSALMRASQITFELFHTNLYDSDVALQYFGAAIPTLDWGTFGIGAARLGVNGIEKRDNNNYLLGSFNDSRMAFYFAYARQIYGLDAGATVMLEHHSLDSYSATSSPGLSLSLSRQYQTNLDWMPSVTMSLNGRNLIRPGIKLVSESVKYPSSFDLGLALNIRPGTAFNQGFMLAAAVRKTAQLDPELALGIEYNLYSLINLRASIKDNDPSFGLGLNYRMIDFDYAFVERELGSLHMFSVSVSLGRTMTEKYSRREARREADFEKLMSDNLLDRNRQMVTDLFKQASTNLEENKFEEAKLLYERGVFLARSNGLDSIAIYVEALEAIDLIDDIDRKQQYETKMDSAYINFERSNYFEARYFTEQALEQIPDSRDALKLLKETTQLIEESTSIDDLIEASLTLADSLINYGQIDKAQAALAAIKKFSDKDARIDLALKKASFEYYSDIAQHDFSESNYDAASANLDSALILFPDHPRCNELKRKIRNLKKRAESTPSEKLVQVNKPELSTSLLAEVKEAYSQGRRLFEAGQLLSAIEQWEKVERMAPDYMSVQEYLIKAYKFVGVELYGQNQMAEAVETWKKAAELDPENTEIAGYIKRTENEIRRLQELTYGNE